MKLPITNEQFESMSRDKSKFFLVVLALRPNVSAWVMDLEYTHYEPDTIQNDKFQFYTSEWQDMPWLVVEIPIEDRHLAEAMAEKYHLRIKDGVPLVFSGHSQSYFPLQGDNVWSIENTDQKMSKEEEAQRCNEIQQNFDEKVNALLGVNLHADPIEVNHSELRPIHGDSLFRKFCPTCHHGVLPVHRNQNTLDLEEMDHCVLCGQRVKYKDINELRRREAPLADFLDRVKKISE